MLSFLFGLAFSLASRATEIDRVGAVFATAPPVVTPLDQKAIARLSEGYQAAYFQILFLARTRVLPPDEQKFLRHIKSNLDNSLDESRDTKLSVNSSLYGYLYLHTPLSDYKTLLYYSSLFRELEISLIKYRAFMALEQDPTRVEQALYGNVDNLLRMQTQATAAEWLYLHYLPGALQTNSVDARLFSSLSLAHLNLTDYIRQQQHRGVYGRPQVAKLVNQYLKNGLPDYGVPILDEDCAKMLGDVLRRARRYL